MGDSENGSSFDEVIGGDLDDILESELAEDDAIDDEAVESGGVAAVEEPGVPDDLAPEDAVPEASGEPASAEERAPSEASVSATVALGSVVALHRLIDVVEAALERPPTVVDRVSPHPTARFSLEDGEFVLASASSRADGGSTLSLVRGRMPAGADVEATKSELRGWLERAASSGGPSAPASTGTGSVDAVS